VRIVGSWIALLLAALLLVAALTLPVRPKESRVVRTRADIRAVIVRASMYRQSAHRLPSPSGLWDEITADQAINEEDRLRINSMRRDVWGSAFEFRIAKTADGHEEFMVISPGPNRRFEGGLGDDLGARLAEDNNFVEW
jgi:hypothetical protein